MERKTFGIGIMTVTAVLLFIAQFMPLGSARAETVIKDRDYSLVTAQQTQGGEGLYIVENRTGLMAVFTWDTGTRSVKLRAVRPVTDAFAR